LDGLKNLGFEEGRKRGIAAKRGKKKGSLWGSEGGTTRKTYSEESKLPFWAGSG